jgi:hypothetical protein
MTGERIDLGVPGLTREEPVVEEHEGRAGASSFVPELPLRNVDEAVLELLRPERTEPAQEGEYGDQVNPHITIAGFNS